MGKIYVSELAAILVEKYGIEKREAQAFIASMVDVIRDGVAQDRLVKVKGLGTFKVVEVDARESVNVNTGERVTIGSHSKLSFTPDAAMKELVNKPFSQFETVILNEGVTFDEEPPAEEEPPVEEETQEEPMSQENESLVEKAPEAEPSEAEPSDAETPEAESPEAEAPEADEQRWRWLLWVPIVMLFGVLCFGGGYYLGRQQKPVKIDAPRKAAALPPAETAALTPAETDSVLSVATESQQTEQEAGETAQAAPQQAQEAPQEAPQATPAPEPDYKKYEAMDNRVRTGAYHIVGLDHVVKVKEGETLYRISRRTLGPNMECYIEVFNGITSATPLAIGQEIKIPKLKMKESAKRKLNR